MLAFVCERRERRENPIIQVMLVTWSLPWVGTSGIAHRPPLGTVLRKRLLGCVADSSLVLDSRSNEQPDSVWQGEPAADLGQRQDQGVRLQPEWLGCRDCPARVRQLASRVVWRGRVQGRDPAPNLSGALSTWQCDFGRAAASPGQDHGDAPRAPWEPTRAQLSRPTPEEQRTKQRLL